ncbi:MAG: type II toxin-antitoxin system VapC family toxin [Solirubrobacterales bacterium]|nr:type II toxin-antitoxin system VapC family toxin [Solirubrobacterales bacterium]
MIDASVVVDAFSGVGTRAEAALRAMRDAELVAPAHMKLEAVSAWRKHTRRDTLSETSALDAIATLRRLDIRELPVEPLLERAWELRENLSVADAAYVALAERLRAPLVTSDGRLTRASGPRCEFRLIE